VGVALRFLRALGCQVEPIHCTPDGRFPHTPEPNFANLQDLCRFTRERGADIGFATDPDGDRVAIVSEQGHFLGEELTLALVAQHVLAQRRHTTGSVAINLSTSRATEDVARAAGCRVVRTPVGEIHVAERMKETHAVFGGEGNGGIIDPKVHYGRDAIVGMGLLLEHLAVAGKRISALAAVLPAWHMLKTRLEMPAARSRALIRRLKAEAKHARVNTEDGLRLDWDDRWVHLRASNTEPIMRIIAEATTAQAAQELVDTYTERVKSLGA